MPIHDTSLMFGAMVFIAIFLLIQSLAVRSVDRKTAKRLQRRMVAIAEAYKDEVSASLLRERYLKRLSPLDQRIQWIPGVPALQRMIEQSGRSSLPVSRLLLLCLLLMAAVAVVGLLFRYDLVSVGLASVLAGGLPVFKLSQERNRRLEQFEEQLPEALDTMVRSLRTGYPFAETLRVVAEELDEPINKQFEATFADINYGMDIRVAFLNLLERVPSINLLSLITAVLIQRETGGNLTEILEKIGTLMRGRSKFQRRVRTLSAEARLSAWILALVPFIAAAAIHVTSPNYLPLLIKDPDGIKIVAVAFGMLVLG
ncbi:MAG: tight adherence protein [Pseudomonadota bacterium]|nr:tight adherence protein [Pseudomonadota bacterium]